MLHSLSFSKFVKVSYGAIAFHYIFSGGQPGIYRGTKSKHLLHVESTALAGRGGVLLRGRFLKNKKLGGAEPAHF